MYGQFADWRGKQSQIFAQVKFHFVNASCPLCRLRCSLSGAMLSCCNRSGASRMEQAQKPDPVAQSSDLHGIRDALSSKPSLWGIAGVVLAAIAIPTALFAVWMPREVDSLKNELGLMSLKLDVQAGILQQVSDMSNNLVEQSQAGVNEINSLIDALSRNDAIDRGFGRYAVIQLKEMLPADLYEAFEEQKFENVRLSSFMNRPTIYMVRSAFNELGSEHQSALISWAAREGVRVELQEQYFPQPAAARALAEYRVPAATGLQLNFELDYERRPPLRFNP
ncbi:MAG: hypothetical protein JJU24_11180 [Natronohydrobacter sp.]|nr:hypothetical protein [Natronohydrobacter sp.]